MPPTFDLGTRFSQDWERLSPEQRRRFRSAVRHFVHDLSAGQFRPGLRVKRVQGAQGVWEMTFAPDGRATWQHGDKVQPGVPHVVWRRIGTHDVFGKP